jgi:hypothetical protein
MSSSQLQFEWNLFEPLDIDTGMAENIEYFMNSGLWSTEKAILEELKPKAVSYILFRHPFADLARKTTQVSAWWQDAVDQRDLGTLPQPTSLYSQVCLRPFRYPSS